MSLGNFKKFNDGKPRFSLLSIEWIKELVEVLEIGASKYGDTNYIKGSQDVYFDSLMRHVIALRLGEKTDKETGKSHLVHAACNLMFMYVLQGAKENEQNGKV